MPLLDSLATQAAGMGLGAIYGLALEKHQDQRQLRQQDKLLYQQQGYNKEMTEWNRMQQMKLWEDTNYKAQMEQLRKAGLNPGLIYGMSGGGGATTNIAQGNVSGAHAPAGGGEIGMGLQMGLQGAMAAAQIENIKADTEVKKATAPKVEEETKSLTQGIENAKQANKIMKLEEQLKTIDVEYQGMSLEDRLQIIGQTSGMLNHQLALAYNEVQVSDSTIESKKEQIRQEAIGAALKNAATEAGITKTEAEIRKMANDILLGWAQLSNEQKKTRIAQFTAEFQAGHPGIMNLLGGAIQRLADGLSKPMPNKNKVE